MKDQNNEKRSIAAVVVGYFTVEWFIKTIIGWLVTLGLTKLWEKFKKWKEERKEKKNA